MFRPSSSAGTFATRAQMESSARVAVGKISNENKFGVEAERRSRQGRLYLDRARSIPFGKPIHIILNSRDVIHSFYVPWFRLYQDAAPGRTISRVWFQVERPGNFELACSQLCGTGSL